MSVRKLGRPATIADLEALPQHIKGEIIDGQLYTYPRPRFEHANIELAIGSALLDPFQRGRGGPGGWWIVVEPGIELPGCPEFSPDLAGWRRETMPEPARIKRIQVVPDWACEILSPSHRELDLRVKRPFYARIGIQHLWFVDPEARALTVSKPVDGRWMELGVYGGDDRVRAEPFEALEIPLGDWWLPRTETDS